MSLQSPRHLRFEGANAPEHRGPRASKWEPGLRTFPRPAISHSSYNNFAPFPRDPAGVPIRETQGPYLFPRAAISHPSYNNFAPFPRDPACVPIRETQGP